MYMDAGWSSSITGRPATPTPLMCDVLSDLRVYLFFPGPGCTPLLLTMHASRWLKLVTCKSLWQLELPCFLLERSSYL